MPKQIFKAGKLQIVADTDNPKDILKQLTKTYKGKTLTAADKVKLYDAYVAAGEINI